MQPTHLYRYFDADDCLLYVGVSASAIRRLLEHAAGKAWAVLVSRVEVQTLPTREAALTEERRVIKEEKPKFNVFHNSGKNTNSVTATSKTKMLATRVPYAIHADLAAMHGPNGMTRTKSEAVILALTCGIASLLNK